MTTINNSQLIEKVGGIEKAREIIAGAHWENISYSNGSYYSHSYGKNDVCLNDLRTAISEHDTDHVTDIRNHISPRTVVWDLAGGEDWTAEAERHG